MRATVTIKCLVIMCLMAPSLFSMEKPLEPMELSVPEVFPIHDLPADLKAYLLTFLIVGKGRTRAAKLHNAAEALRNCMMLNKSFASILKNKRANKHLVEYLSRYTGGNLTQAGLALATVGAREYLESLSFSHNRWYFPIHQEINWAAAQGDDISLNTLIKCHYNVPAAARVNAACAGHLSTIELLYAPEVNISGDMTDKDTPLIVACRSGHTQMVQKLLGIGEDPCHISREGIDRSPLFVAAEWGHIGCVTLLLATNARTQIDFQDMHGKTALMLAAQRGAHHVVQTLLAAGAQVNLKDRFLLNALSNTVKTDCSSAEYITIVQDLLAAGAEVNVPDIDGRKALSAVRINPGNSLHKKTIEKILLDHGAVE